VVAALRGAGGVGRPGPDRFLAPDIEAAYSMVRAGRIVAAAESVTGRLQ
jgi:histidine ammonia-lyase